VQSNCKEPEQILFDRLDRVLSNIVLSLLAIIVHMTWRATTNRPTTSPKSLTITLIILIQTTEWYQRQGKISCYTTYLTFNVKYDDGAIIPSEIIDTAESLGCGR
jgi:hypothetical protein